MFYRNHMLFIGLIILVSFMIQGCKPSLVVSPQQLVFSAGETTKSFQVWNGTQLTKLNFTVQPQNNWITVNPDSGTSNGPNDKKTIQVSISRDGIPTNAPQGSIVVKSSNVGEKVVEVIVSSTGGEGEGTPEGVVEGASEGTGEGTVEGGGTVEGASEGTGEGTVEGEGTGEGAVEGEQPPQEEISIIGWVKDVDNNPVGYATVELLSTAHKIYSDPTGLFIFEKVEDGTYVLSVRKEGYTNYSLEIEVGEVKPLTVNVVLKRILLVGELNAETGGKVEDGDGNSIDIPPNSLIDKDGNPVVGNVEVYITPLELSNPNELSAFPGGFQGISLTKNGERVMLESFALADIKVMQNGEELNLNPAKAVIAMLLLSLPDDTPLQAGQEVPLWYFDEEQGLWIESGTGTVIEDGGKKYYQANIPHLSWWNCDAPLEDKNCINGMVEDKNGYAVPGAMVKAVGVSYNGITTGYTDTSGYFCLNVKRNSTFDLEVYLPGGNTPVVVQQYTGVDKPTSCETGGCIQILNPIVADYNSCVQGYVRDSEGNAIVGAVVRSSIGTTTVTNSNGYYCLDAFVPEGESEFVITVFTLSRPPVIVTVYPGANCTNGDCAEANIEIEYPEDGDYVGYLSVSQQKYKYYGMEEPYYYVEPFAIFATFPASPLIPPVLDNCVLAVGQYEIEEEGEEGESVVTLNWSGLDPGSPGYFIGGNYYTDMVRYADLVSEWGWHNLEPWMYSQFVSATPSSMNTPITDFVCGWPGGLDIDKFEFFSSIPPDLVVTSPSYEENYYYNTFNYNPNEDLLVEWVPAEVPSGLESYVQIILNVNITTWDEQGGRVTYGTIMCNVVDDGSYIIPRELLQQLPELVQSETTQSSVNLTIKRVYAKEVEVPLVRGGFGKLQVYSDSSLIMSYFPDWIPGLGVEKK